MGGPNSESGVSASDGVPLVMTPPCWIDGVTSASPQYVMFPPSTTLAAISVSGFARILPPLTTEAVTLPTDIERISIVPPLSTVTPISA